MLILQGRAAFTPFRLSQKLHALQTINPEITRINAHYIYFVDCDVVTPELVRRLEVILPHAEYLEHVPQQDDFHFWVVPRLGTISPWSSKATDILQTCEIDGVTRIERGVYWSIGGVKQQPSHNGWHQTILQACYDPLTESVLSASNQFTKIFQQPEPLPVTQIDVLNGGLEALQAANTEYGLALSETEINYLLTAYQNLKRNPTATELMMFGQINSEHCRHKIFNAHWQLDDVDQPHTLFNMIRNTYKQNPEQALVAYNDNAAVLVGHDAERFFVDPQSQLYQPVYEAAPIVLKVETHNHPTAISPFPGAATGSGGEIRDEAATGRGSVAKAGLCGFTTSHLNLSALPQPWESNVDRPPHMASAQEIMLQGPIGAAAFNNEFGRPNICGYFRTFELGDRGYHKPIMIAGGVGNIRKAAIQKNKMPARAKLIVLGGPAMAIGLGGGSASSLATGTSSSELDFASVQRANPEMQRRCQEVINRCWLLGKDNPIISIHDVGAGGLSNALPELVKDSERGAVIQLRDIPNAAPGMSPMEIWCNEAQERFVLAIHAKDVALFTQIAERERCPFAVVGEAIDEQRFELHDERFNNSPVDMPMATLFDDMPRLQCRDKTVPYTPDDFTTDGMDIADAIKRVLQFPCVADKTFLITIGDRSVGGMVSRDQMVGPWQVPVADVGVTTNSFKSFTGEALAMGERTPLALLDAAAAARMAVGEAITNIAAAPVAQISDLVLSANWMAAAKEPGEGSALYAAVNAIGMELCPTLGISIPVGKDSMSMRATWQHDGQARHMTSPVSLIISAAAKVKDVRRTLTPQLRNDVGETQLILIDLGEGHAALGGSVLAQVYNKLGQTAPDVRDAESLKQFFAMIQALNAKGYIQAYHDRSDGGLLACLSEMAFAGRMGFTVNLDKLHANPLAALFNEELGAVIQVAAADLNDVLTVIKTHELDDCCHIIGEATTAQNCQFVYKGKTLFAESRVTLQRWWSETSYRMQSLRDNSDCAQQAFDAILDQKNPGLSAKLSFDVKQRLDAGVIEDRPRVAILREQGVNGHNEMAAAFYYAGFDSVDVHMSDLIAGQQDLADFTGLVACGGFSYGDVLGAGRGWAQSILQHPTVRQQFADFFNRPDTFTLGVCNGCQMLSQLKELIPGAAHWPNFEPNVSEQFEARLAMVEVLESPSIFLRDMHGSTMPVVISHGEGRAEFADSDNYQHLMQHHQLSLRYVDNHLQPTETYPANPNGSVGGLTGFTSEDGRVTIMMPHPERVFRTVQMSWHPQEWGDYSPWMRMFENARAWVAQYTQEATTRINEYD